MPPQQAVAYPEASSVRLDVEVPLLRGVPRSFGTPCHLLFRTSVHNPRPRWRGAAGTAVSVPADLVITTRPELDAARRWLEQHYIDAAAPSASPALQEAARAAAGKAEEAPGSDPLMEGALELRDLSASLEGLLLEVQQVLSFEEKLPQLPLPAATPALTAVGPPVRSGRSKKASAPPAAPDTARRGRSKKAVVTELMVTASLAAPATPAQGPLVADHADGLVAAADKLLVEIAEMDAWGLAVSAFGATSQPAPSAPSWTGSSTWDQSSHPAADVAAAQPSASAAEAGTAAVGLARLQRHLGQVGPLALAAAQLLPKRTRGSTAAAPLPALKRRSKAVEARTSNTGDVMTRFMRQSLGHRLLSRAEEVELCKDYAGLTSVLAAERQLTAALGRAPRQKEMTFALDVTVSELLGLEQRGRDAQATLVRCNIKLVLSVARKYGMDGMPTSDLLAAGMRGLQTAVERFQPGRGLRFSTFATWWIRAFVSRMQANCRTIRVPSHLGGIYRKVVRVQADVLRHQQREATIAELAQRVGTSSGQVLAALRLMAPGNAQVSTAAASGEDGAELQDVLEDMSIPSPDSHLLEQQCRVLVQAALADLPPRERDIVTGHLGLGTAGGKRESLATLARRHKMSSQSTLTLFQKTMWQMQQATSLQGLSELSEARRMDAQAVLAPRVSALHTKAK